MEAVGCHRRPSQRHWTREDLKPLEAALDKLNDKNPKLNKKQLVSRLSKTVRPFALCRPYVELLSAVEDAFEGRNSDPSADLLGSLGLGIEMDEAEMRPKERKGPWDEEEQRFFLRGLIVYGWGSWQLMSEDFVPTRSLDDIKHHAYKYRAWYYTRESGKIRKGNDVLDLTLKDDNGNALPLPRPPWPSNLGPTHGVPCTNPVPSQPPRLACGDVAPVRRPNSESPGQPQPENGHDSTTISHTSSNSFGTIEYVVLDDD